jgi:transcriptional regulator with XRE-family HTH domain
MTKIGDRIAYLRKAKGISQTALAKSVNASREAIGKYERNEAMPSVETAKKIADVFEVTLDYLVDENSLPTFDKKTVNRLKDIQLLSDDDKKHVFALLDAFLTRTKLQNLL